MSPGPGAYLTRSVAFEYERPRFYMGERNQTMRETTAVPGVGSYNPMSDKIKKSLPQYSMKIKLGSSLTDTRMGPGPGNYDIVMENKKSSPKFGFGSSTRDGQTARRLAVPGPGSYELKSMIGDVP